MKKISKTVVFFGSGPVAAKSLELLSENFQVEAVITKPRPPHHKGDTPVLNIAKQLNLPVHTAKNKKELDDLFSHKVVQSQLGILIDFGIIVSQKVIDYFPLGIINSHFSLLPEWRGADPITFSILSGQKKTGISLMMLTAGMDEGPLLAQSEFDVTPNMTTPELTEKLIELSDKTLEHIIPLYVNHEIEPAPQDIVSLAPNKKPTYSRRLSKEDGVIDWNKPAEVIEREIRAYAGWPKSRTDINNLDIVITKAHVISASGQPNKTTIIDKQPAVFCGQNALIIDELKPAGKKEMPGSAFLAGYKTVFIG